MSAVHVSFYDPATGFFSGSSYHGPEDHVEMNTPAGHAAIEGRHDHRSRRVDLSGAEPIVVDYQPPAPSPDHEWSGETRRWQLNRASQMELDARTAAVELIAILEASQHRALREYLLRGDPEMKARIQAIDDHIASLRTTAIGVKS